MRRFACITVFVAFSPIVCADDLKTSASEQLAKLKREVEKDYAALRADAEKAKDNAALVKLYDDFYTRAAPFCEQALTFADGNRGDPASFEALVWIVDGPFGYNARSGPIIERALEAIIERHIADERLNVNMRRLNGVSSRNPERLLRLALAHNPSRDVRGRACIKLGDVLFEQFQCARDYRDALRKQDVAWWNKTTTPEMREYFLKFNPNEVEKEAEAFYERAANQFNDVKTRGDVLVGDLARGKLFQRRNLVVGKPFPVLSGTDLEGKPVNLADYRGKVVAVVFWAGWCGPCMAMVPQERELVKRFDSKPFALIGINGDESLAAAKKAAGDEQMTWRSIFDGNAGRGPIAIRWGIASWPTVYFIDAQGILRQIYDHQTPLADTVAQLLGVMK